jgi:hypothetical protein
MSMAIATIESAGVEIDHAAVLKSLNLNPRDPNTQALLLVCERYGLDPLLKHMVLISGNPYITRDGYLAIAHRSGEFDGMEVLEQGADETHFTAKVAVYRKDMGRPFTFIGRYPKGQRMAKDYGPEMAVKVAEVQALRRAFNVTGVPAADERWDEDAEPSRGAMTHTRTSEMAQVVDTKELPPATEDGEPVASEKLAEQVADLQAALKEAGDEWADRGRAAWKLKGIPNRKPHLLSHRDAESAFAVLSKVYQEVPASQPTLDGDAA